MTRRLVSAVAAMVLAAAATVVGAAPAYALGPTISCTGWQHDTFTPGLTNTTQTITITIADRLNVIDSHSPTGSCLALFSTASAGTQDRAFDAPWSCTSFDSLTETDTYTWNNGHSSTMNMSGGSAIVGGNNVITFTGTVTSGEFSGNTAVLTLTAATTAFAACSSTGITSLDFIETLTLL